MTVCALDASSFTLMVYGMLAQVTTAQLAGDLNQRNEQLGAADSTRSYRLERAAALGTASIIGVIRAQSGVELRGARVSLSASGNSDSAPLREVISGRDGWFALIEIPPGTYTLRVTLDRYENATQTNTVLRAGDALIVEKHLAPVSAAAATEGQRPVLSAANSTRLYRLPRAISSDTASIIGVIRTQEGIQLGGAHIMLSSAGDFDTNLRREVVTRGDGWFGMMNILPGTYVLGVTLDGYESLTETNTILNAGDALVVERQLARITPSPTAGLTSLRAHQGNWPAAGSDFESRSLISPVWTGVDAAPAEPVADDTLVFTPIDSRWSYQYPLFRRYDGSGDFQFDKGHWYDPYHVSRLKGDIPVKGNRIFLALGAVSETFNEQRRLPFAPLPSRAPSGLSLTQNVAAQTFSFSIDLSKGDAAYQPVDWRVRVTVAANSAYASVAKPGLLNFKNPELTRFAIQAEGIQEGFFERKLKNLNDAFDTVSVRAGIQNFTTDFRGFIFSTSAPGIRVFGSSDSNKYQYNLAAFDMLAKDANSGLNTLVWRKQQVFVANLYRQDFLTRGYTFEISAHYDKDDPSIATNVNNFQVRPVPIQGAIPHAVRVLYLGLAGDGHIGRLNVSHAFYQAYGHDTFNAVAGRPVKIDARMAALEASLDRNWVRYRASLFYSSGDRDPHGNRATGFDSILDNANFAGGVFSFWNREILNFSSRGVALTNGGNLEPDLRSGKTSGQANFVNPGLILVNAGTDLDLTQKLRCIFNANLIRFDHTQPLEALLGIPNIHAGVGADAGIGLRYRPALNDHVVFVFGVDALFPAAGLRQIYLGGPFLAVFTDLQFRF